MTVHVSWLMPAFSLGVLVGVIWMRHTLRTRIAGLRRELEERAAEYRHSVLMLRQGGV